MPGTRWVCLLLLGLLVSVFSACSAAVPVPTPTPAPPAAITITDDRERTLTFSAPPQRIVSLAPSVTEILFAVGAGPQLVGRTAYCNFPPEAAALPEIGGFSASSISVEAIVGLQPDLVIAGSASQLEVLDALDALQVPTLLLAPDSFAAVYENIVQLATITGHEAEGSQVVASMEARVAAVTETVASIPPEQRPTVFWQVYNDPLITAGPQTFIGQLIELAGATNIFADASEDYPQISAEAVAERDPVVILGPASQREALVTEQIAVRPGWAELRAVRDGRIYLLDEDIVSRPGPRLADALEQVAAALYPEVFE
jgi:iron complex transport system substrate-binding protein